MTHWWDNSFSAGGSGTKSADPPGLWWPVSCTEVRCWNRNPDRWQDDLHSYIVYSYNILIWINFYKYSIIPISILSSFFHHHFSIIIFLWWFGSVYELRKFQWCPVWSQLETLFTERYSGRTNQLGAIFEPGCRGESTFSGCDMEELYTGYTRIGPMIFFPQMTRVCLKWIEMIRFR